MLLSTTATHIGHIDWTLVCGVVVCCLGTRPSNRSLETSEHVTVGVLTHRSPGTGRRGRGRGLGLRAAATGFGKVGDLSHIPRSPIN